MKKLLYILFLFISISAIGQTQAYYSAINKNKNPITPYPPVINNEPLPDLTDFTIKAVGNSITQCCTQCTFTYVKVLNDSLSVDTVINKGVSGNTLARIPGTRVGFRSQVQQSYGDSIISIFGGTNDWFFDVPLGDTTIHNDTNNVAGAINYFIDLIKENSPESIIILITPLTRSRDQVGIEQSVEPTNNLGFTTEDYRNKIIEVGVFRGVRILDLYQINGLTFDDIDNWGGDGLHPNNTGQMRLGRIYKSFLLNEDYQNLY